MSRISLVTAAGSNSNVENQSGEVSDKDDLILTEQQKQLLIELRDSLGKPTAKTESYLTIDNKGNYSGRQTKGCTNDSCPVDVYSNTAIALHRHVNTDSRSKSINVELTKTREFPGYGDHTILEHNVINALITPKGALRVVERVNGLYRVSTLHGGSKQWDDIVESKWYPGMNTSQMEQVINEAGL